jgi:hypothetical protein
MTMSDLLVPLSVPKTNRPDLPASATTWRGAAVDPAAK